VIRFCNAAMGAEMLIAAIVIGTALALPLAYFVWMVFAVGKGSRNIM
jgi:hypothetical protein